MAGVKNRNSDLTQADERVDINRLRGKGRSENPKMLQASSKCGPLFNLCVKFSRNKCVHGTLTRRMSPSSDT